MLSILEKKTLSGIFGAIEAKSSVKENQTNCDRGRVRP